MCVLGSVMLVSCGTPGAPIPPSLELPGRVTDLHATRKGDKVYLAWTVPSKTTERQTVRHPGPTRICRSLKAEMADCKNPVAELPACRFPLPRTASSTKGATVQKVQASYIDILPRDLQTTGEITYAVAVLNESGRSAGLSNAAKVPSAPTLPPPENFNAEVDAEGVLLSWKCPTVPVEVNPAFTYKLRVYRREGEKQTDTKVSDVNFADCAHAQPANETGRFLDQTFEWEKRYDYRAAVVTIVSESGKPELAVEGDDTPVRQVFAHDVYPPATPSSLQAVFSGAGQKPFVDLVWSAGTEADLAGYNIYRHEAGGQPAKLNSQLVKTPAYRDTDVQSGRKYFYSVSAVDDRNNESTRSEETEEQIP
jgi:hypothetical protein